MRHWLSLILVAVSASAWAQATDTRLSSKRVIADPAGQYVLIKKVVAGLAPPVTSMPVDADGYDIAGKCWFGPHVMGDWAKQAGLTGRLVMLAMETTSWARALGNRGGYPDKPLAEAIGRYEAAVIAAGGTESARDRGLDALAAELVALQRANPTAIKTRKAGGCVGTGPEVRLRYKTIPEGGVARFVPKALFETCKAQGLDPNDSTICDYWMESSDSDPRFFIGEIVWHARWPDGTITRGEFDARSVTEPGVVTLRQKLR